MVDLTPGIYEQLVTNELQLRLAEIDAALVDRGPLDPADASEILVRHLTTLARRVLRSVPGGDAAALARQVALANRIAETIIALAPDVAGDSDRVSEARDLLQAIAAPTDVPGPVRFPACPRCHCRSAPSSSMGGTNPASASRFRRSSHPLIASTCLCAFVKWYGVRVLEEHIRRSSGAAAGCASSPRPTSAPPTGGPLTGSPNWAPRSRSRTRRGRRAARQSVAVPPRHRFLDRLRRLVESLEGRAGRRPRVERPALADRAAAISSTRSGRRSRSTGTTRPSSATTRPTAHRARLDEALAAERGGPPDLPIEHHELDVRPCRLPARDPRRARGRARGARPLAQPRGDGDRHRQDGRRRARLPPPSRSRRRRLAALRRPSRGDPGAEPVDVPPHPARRLVRRALRRRRTATEWRHVFASVQSLAGSTSIATCARPLRHGHRRRVPPRARRPTYLRDLLEHVEPKVLLGLTATPERADGAGHP